MDLYIRSAVRTKDTLNRKDFIAKHSNKVLRRPGALGVVTSFVDDNHVMVRHAGDTQSAIYWFDELEETPAYWTVTRETEAGPFFKEFDNFESIEGYLDELGVDKKDVTIDGPTFGAKELAEGLIPLRDMFDLLLEDDETP